jgi:serine/threonine protein kinase
MIIASLEHYNIVRILDFGMKGGIPYLVMSYAPNGSLRKQHPQGERLKLVTVLNYVQQLANAIEYIHKQGLVHQDIKPENILLGRNSKVWLSDFGITIVVREASSQSTQSFTGTLSYMAPERIQGKPCAASDQYALGVVVYEWLTGKRPFQGSPEQVMRQHIHARPPFINAAFPDISPEIERVVLKSLAKDPRDRFPSIQDFAVALTQAANNSNSLPKVRPPASADIRYKVWDDIAKLFIFDIFASILLGIITYLSGMIPSFALFNFGLSLLILPTLTAINQKNSIARIMSIWTFITSVVMGLIFHSVLILSITQLSLLTLTSLVIFLWRFFRKFF